MLIPILRAGQDDALIEQRLFSRSQIEQPDVTALVRGVLADIRARGDAALFDYTERFDRVRLTPETLIASQEEIERAYAQIPPQLLDTIRRAAANIRAFHEKQRTEGFIDFGPGLALGQLVRPIARAGVYAPGGTAAYPSSVLMNVIPAKVAGVPEILLATPPDKTGSVSAGTLVAAVEAGASAVYKMGGAQAIGALAFGTQSVPRVDKITGPGNVYVSNAKREVFGYVGIDMIAGPSEVLIVADGSANPAYIAADMLSQAEHDELAMCVLVTTDTGIASAAAKALKAQLECLERRDIARAALENYGAIIVVDSLDAGLALSNRVAPEHLELAVAEPLAYLGQVQNAGAVFLGHFTPEPVGDYFAGPNHVLPTSGMARFFSPLGVYDFFKRTSVIGYSRDSLRDQYRDISSFAQMEGLGAHARSVEIRFEEDPS